VFIIAFKHGYPCVTLMAHTTQVSQSENKNVW